jgi:ERCC4-related helicase
MRVEIRDAEWRIDKVDTPTHGGQLLICTGQSELVRGITGSFLTELENNLQVLTPESTSLVDDLSSGYAATQLYIETMLSMTPPSDERIHLGHEAAMDLLPYQLDPAIQALNQTRPRMLIADAVGLGKTLSAGILLTELIQRHRGKRILVLAVKSMLAQFQRELWQRFTIPLVRLDSVGLQRMRSQIPTNHNPFHYFDRAIISMDTLKQNIEYLNYLENTHWDVVVIDEAHNVAKRSNNSLRHRLAARLSSRCDAMIMLSATPHDGKPESFASLINMLDPTAIPNPKEYSHEDYRDKGLVVRRFKSAVAQQLSTSLPEREVFPTKAPTTDLEEIAFREVRGATFKTLNRGSGGAGQLFRTTLEKALLSSPAACLSTIENRLKRLNQKEPDEDIRHDVSQLEGIQFACSAIEPAGFSKLTLLVQMLDKKSSSIGWDRDDPNDRIVLFTESVVTLNYLAEQLSGMAKLKKGQWSVLHGGMRDIEQIDIVNEFSRPQSPLRLLLCSDVASEGLNLHHCSHRLIHFDIPWSLMVFQQRNGRVDRYGQTLKPEIYYLMSEAQDVEVRRDQRVLEVLIEKDTQASKNLGDPSEFMGGDSIESQEEQTAEAIESDQSDAGFSDLLDSALGNASSGIEAFCAAATPTSSADLLNVVGDRSRVYSSTLAFAEAGLKWLETTRTQLNWSIDKQVIDLEAPADLQQVMKRMPREAIPENRRFFLSPDKSKIQDDMVLARDDETDTFGRLQYLWPQHPVVEWLMRNIQDAFGRHTAPAVRMPEKLAHNEHWFILQGGFPNRRGQALIQDQVGVHFVDDQVVAIQELGEVIDILKLNGQSIPNRAEAKNCDELTLYLQDAVEQVRNHLVRLRDEIKAVNAERIQTESKALQDLQKEHISQLEFSFSESGAPETLKAQRQAKEREKIDELFKQYQTWLRDTWETEPEPYIQVVAVFTGNRGEVAS